MRSLPEIIKVNQAVDKAVKDQYVRLRHWDVKVFLDGVCCLTITEDSISGINDLNDGDLKAIEQCGKQLLGFAGKGT